jgi:hypothetical protein
VTFRVDNVDYVLVLNTGGLGRRFGWSRGPDTDAENGMAMSADQHDWPVPGRDTWTFHWIAANGTVLADTQVNVLQVRQNQNVRHLKNYTNETTGIWEITDLARLVTVLRARGLNAQADIVEASPLIPRVGDLAL